MSSPEQNYFSLFAMRYPVAWEFSVWADTSREIKIVFKVSIKFLVPRKKGLKKDGLRRRKLAQTTTQNQENKRKMLLIRKGVFVYKPWFFFCDLWNLKKTTATYFKLHESQQKNRYEVYKLRHVCIEKVRTRMCKKNLLRKSQ